MSVEEVYKTPESGLNSEVDVQEKPQEKPSILVRFMAIVFSAPIALAMFFKQSSVGGVAGGIGGVIGSLIPALIIVMLFQIGKRFRNSRSRWKVFMWAQFVFLLGQIVSVLQAIGKHV